MTYKYPDVVSTIRRCVKRDCSFVVDAEIVAIVPTQAPAESEGATANSAMDCAAYNE